MASLDTMDELNKPHNRSDLLGRIFTCSCGKIHQIPTETYHYRPDSLQRIAETTTKFSAGRRVLVVVDRRTREAAGNRVIELLTAAGLEVLEYCIRDEGGKSPKADDKTKDTILAEAPENDILVAVGSGVINDLVKWVAFLQEKPYLTVPTAASMNGYASANVAATVDGLKVLFHATPCRAVLADSQILADAPDELTTSGLGDVLAKSVSSADWKMNQILFGDYYCQYAVDLLRDLEPIYLDNPLGIRSRDPEALQALFEALFYSSLAMTMTGTSSPASGGEHLISHTLDMIADRDNRQHDLHGRQVGVASILTAALYERVMAIETPRLCPFPQSIDAAFWGDLAPVVEAEYVAKLPRIEIAAQVLADPKRWSDLRRQVQPGLVATDRLKNCLRQAGGAHRFSDIRDNGSPISRAKYSRTVLAANQMRRRFTILDVALMLGVLPDGLDEIVDNWVSR